MDLTPGPENHTGISFSGELERKGLHLLALALPLGVLLLGRDVALMILLPVTGLALTADLLRDRYQWANRLVRDVFGRMMRTSELPPTGGGIVINGATWTLISITLLVVLFPTPIAVVSFSMAMIGDAAAALLGRKFGRHNWGRPGCTVEGSLAYAGAALLTGLLLVDLQAGLPGREAAAVLGGSIAAAVTEGLRLPGNDNVNAPLACALVVFLIERSLSLVAVLSF